MPEITKIEKEWEELSQNLYGDWYNERYEEEIKQFINSKIEEVIAYIGKDQGWEESEDIYRKHYGFKEKYNLN